MNHGSEFSTLVYHDAMEAVIHYHFQFIMIYSRYQFLYENPKNKKNLKNHIVLPKWPISQTCYDECQHFAFMAEKILVPPFNCFTIRDISILWNLKGSVVRYKGATSVSAKRTMLSLRWVGCVVENGTCGSVVTHFKGLGDTKKLHTEHLILTTQTKMLAIHVI